MNSAIRRARRALVVLLTLALLLPLAAGCTGNDATTGKPAAYGSFGADFARTLASANRIRAAGTDGERKTGDRIVEALRDLGYEPDISEFSFTAEGATQNSRNIIVRIPGTGVVAKDGDGTVTEQRQAIIGAHYDTPVKPSDVNPSPTPAPSGPTPKPGRKPTPTPTPEPTQTTIVPTGINWVPTWSDYTGISDNAASIGALMVMARELKTQQNAHDVILVAFGAGHAGQAGARHFVNEMSRDEIDRTDVMYNIENIYAGDKLYASAGQNSIRPDYQKDYEKRRKLYEVTDIYYEYELFSNNRVALYTNQSVIELDQNRAKIKAPYREWTTHESDYLPFDEKGIPIVFFESFDYDVETLEEMRESNNPAFTATNGRISGTPYDSTRFLDQLFEQQQAALTPTPVLTPTPAPTGAATGTNAGTETGRTPEDEGTEAEVKLENLLTRRINNTAFIIIMAIRKSGNVPTPAESSRSTESSRSAESSRS